MKKNAVTAKADDPGDKSIFRQAGEVIGSIGAHLVNAKDTVVDFVSHEVVIAKKTAKKIGRKVKKAAKKRQQKNEAKKLTKKVKQTAKTTPVKKSVKKVVRKALVKKSVKKIPKKSATIKSPNSKIK